MIVVSGVWCDSRAAATILIGGPTAERRRSSRGRRGPDMPNEHPYLHRPVTPPPEPARRKRAIAEAEFGAGSMQARIDQARLGGLISLGVSCTSLQCSYSTCRLATEVHLMRFVHRTYRVTGLDPDWGVFAPPRTISLYVEGHIDHADGTTTTVDIPSRRGSKPTPTTGGTSSESGLRLAG